MGVPKCRDRSFLSYRGTQEYDMTTHYPKRRSNVKRRRKFGFRSRMKTSAGRKIVNRKRRDGRALTVRGL